MMYIQQLFRTRLFWLATLCFSALLAQAEGPLKATEISTAVQALVELKPAPLLIRKNTQTNIAGQPYQPASNNMTAAAQQSPHEVAYDLPIDYQKGEIYNPATGKNDTVKLRSYNGQFIAPTAVMEPGQTVRFNVINNLPVPKVDCARADMNTPAPDTCFNVTNLHSHGLWVSPTGNSDNVLLSINPGVAFEYEYNVPADHPAGTFWYHPHMHGSTAMQVASGMAGAIVIKGSRKPTASSHGDVDTLLEPITLKNGSTQDEVKLLQQIPYACFDANGNIKTKYPVTKDRKFNPWVCDEGDVGIVESFDSQVGGPSIWGSSGRFTLINGQARPGINLRTGQIYRWRLIDAGFNETVNLRIKKVTSEKYLHKTTLGEEEVKRACNGLDVTQFEIASDGLTHSKIIPKITNTLQPGYRSDILFSLPEKGLYCVYDDSSDADTSVNANHENAKVLAIIIAKGDDNGQDQQVLLRNQLVAAATTQYEGSVRDEIIGDLKNGLQLRKFVPHQTITNQEIINSKQNPVYIEFNLVIPPTQNPSNIPFQFLINNSAYQPGRIDHTLILGTAQTWFLSSKSVNHPFHIHVNPFEIISITDKATGKPSTDPQYQNLVGTWKDTIFVTTGVTIETRTRYERYIGEYVLHCHILEHEDQGMMQNVQVVLPNGNGGGMKPGHH